MKGRQPSKPHRGHPVQGPQRDSSPHIFIATEDPDMVSAIKSQLNGYENTIFSNSDLLIGSLENNAGPVLVFLDNAMKRTDARSLSTRIRLIPNPTRHYVVLLARDMPEKQSNADSSPVSDDLLTVPFSGKELRARFATALRIMRLEMELSSRIIDLRKATTRIEELNGLLPICSHCKRILDDKGYWNEVETYITNHSNVEFSHAICPCCLQEFYPDVKDEDI